MANKNSFWSNKPVNTNGNIDKLNNILDAESVLLKIQNELDNSKINLEYNVIDSIDLTDEKIKEIVNFLNINYIASNDNSIKLVYTEELFKFCCNNAIILEFYPKNNKNIIGYILGKKSKINLFKKIIDTSEVNFLCVIPKLRSLGVSSYMINSLSKELINRCNILSAHYTISNKINSPYFSEKFFFYRFINIFKLVETDFIRDVNTKLLIDVYNTFNFKDNFNKKHVLKYIHNEDVDNELLETLYNKYIEYCNDKYDIYESIGIDEFKLTFKNKMFHHFVIFSKDKGKVVSYVSLFRIDSYNKVKRNSHKVGYYYYMFFNGVSVKNLSNCLELINEFIYKNDIFDVITFSDIFDVNYNDLKCIKGECSLRYYLYNLNCRLIENPRNGLITI